MPSIPKPSMPKVSIPRPSLGMPQFPDGAKGTVVALLFVALLFGPHVWFVAEELHEAELTSDLLDAVPNPISFVFDEFLGGDSAAEPPEIPKGEAGDLLADLELRDEREPEEADGYDRSLFMSSWTDVDGSGCTTREDILIDAFEGAEIDGCTVTAGTGEAVSLYDGVTMTDPSEVDIEHVVALQDMWLSGAWDWDEGRHSVAAQDDINLIAVTAASNRSKGALGPDQWEPSAGGEAACEYAIIYVTVKATYELSVVEEQRDALAGMLNSC